MELSLIITKKIVVMFGIVLIGFICAKIGMIDPQTNKRLSGIALHLVTPMLIFKSYQSTFDDRIVRNLLWSFLLVIAAYAVMIPLVLALVRKKGAPAYRTERMAILFPNCGFFGIPLVESLYGAEGAIYLTAYITMFNVLIWTVGVAIVSGKVSLKDFLKSFRSPSIIAAVLGLITLLFRFRLPDLVMQPIRYVSDMNTPLAMIVAGATLASADLLPCLKKPRTYYVLFLKLLAIPSAVAAVILLFRYLNVNEMLLMITVIATACPTGAACTMLALLYDREPAYASDLFAIATLTSVATIPLVFMLAQFLLTVYV